MEEVRKEYMTAQDLTWLSERITNAQDPTGVVAELPELLLKEPSPMRVMVHFAVREIPAFATNDILLEILKLENNPNN
jgi:hypothetical protein